jgi:hypothetical protein
LAGVIAQSPAMSAKLAIMTFGIFAVVIFPMSVMIVYGLWYRRHRKQDVPGPEGGSQPPE